MYIFFNRKVHNPLRKHIEIQIKFIPILPYTTAANTLQHMHNTALWSLPPSLTLSQVAAQPCPHVTSALTHTLTGCCTTLPARHFRPHSHSHGLLHNPARTSLPPSLTLSQVAAQPCPHVTSALTHTLTGCCTTLPARHFRPHSHSHRLLHNPARTSIPPSLTLSRVTVDPHPLRQVKNGIPIFSAGSQVS